MCVGIHIRKFDKSINFEILSLLLEERVLATQKYDRVCLYTFYYVLLYMKAKLYKDIFLFLGIFSSYIGFCSGGSVVVVVVVNMTQNQD